LNFRPNNHIQRETDFVTLVAIRAVNPMTRSGAIELCQSNTRRGLPPIWVLAVSKERRRSMESI